MAFSGHLVGHHPQGRRHVFCAVKGPFRASSADNAGQFKGHRFIAPGFEHRLHHLFIFLGRKGTGGVDHFTADGQQFVHRLHELFLTLGAGSHPPRGPLGRGIGIFAKHALAAAGRVHLNFIKNAGKSGQQFFGKSRGQHAVDHAHALGVFRQYFGTGRHQFVGDNHALAGKLTGQLRRFAAGRRAQIQHRIPGLRGKGLRRDHGRRLLHIIKAGVIGDVFSRSDVGGNGITRRAPRHSLTGKGHQALKSRLVYFQRIAANALMGRRVKSLGKTFPFVLHQPFHFIAKSIG